MTFESALQELEEITTKLEEGKETLEESMSLYDRGVILKKFCEKKLKEAEGRWTVLKKNNEGWIEETALDKEELNPQKQEAKTPENPDLL